MNTPQWLQEKKTEFETLNWIGKLQFTLSFIVICAASLYCVYLFYTELLVLIHTEPQKRLFFAEAASNVSVILGLAVSIATYILAKQLSENSSSKNNVVITEINEKIGEAQKSIEKVIQNNKGIAVVEGYQNIITEINSLFNLAKDNQKKSQLKVMNHSAAFGRLLAYHIESIRATDQSDNIDYRISCSKENQNIKIFNASIDAFRAVGKKDNNFYITYNATGDTGKSKYFTAYLEPFKLKESSCNHTCKKFTDPKECATENRKYLRQQGNPCLTTSLNNQQIDDVKKLQTVCNVHFTNHIPLQAFVTLPTDPSAQTDETRYKAILFFINNGTTMDEYNALKAVVSTDRNFVMMLANILDGERDNI